MSEYKKKTWEKGEVISAEALNNMENGIYKANEAAAKDKGIAVTAQPGQFILVKEVNEKGIPTAWDAVGGVPYVEKTEFAELPLAVEWAADDNSTEGTVNAPIGLKIGNTYTVKCNGTDYEVTGQDLLVISGGEMPGVVIGNMSIMGGEDTGEPFILLELPAEVSAELGGVYAQILVAGAVESFAIYGETEIAHKCDYDLLPDGVPYSANGRTVKVPTECMPDTVFWVTGSFIYSNSFDHTLDEIREAFNNGQAVWFRNAEEPTEVAPCIYFEAGVYAVFMRFNTSGIQYVKLLPDGTIA